MNRRALVPLLTVVLVAIVLATLLTGDAVWIVPGLVLLALIGLMSLGEVGLKKRAHDRAGDPMSDHTDPVPSTHLATDTETPLGDTTEAHDEITPHDLPKDHPGRAAAEREARHSREGIVQGNVER
jgi:hypothetical protein